MNGFYFILTRYGDPLFPLSHLGISVFLRLYANNHTLPAYAGRVHTPRIRQLEYKHSGRGVWRGVGWEGKLVYTPQQYNRIGRVLFSSPTNAGNRRPFDGRFVKVIGAAELKVIVRCTVHHMRVPTTSQYAMAATTRAAAET